MTREEAIEVIKEYRDNLIISPSNQLDGDVKAFDMAIQALSQEPTIGQLFSCEEVEELRSKIWKQVEQEPCEDAVSREWLMRKATERFYTTNYFNHISAMIEEAPSVTQKSGKCKNCKYFEYDSVAKVDGVPLIVAHEICNKWGDGCKTNEDGYCFLFEPQESEG